MVGTLNIHILMQHRFGKLSLLIFHPIQFTGLTHCQVDFSLWVAIPALMSILPRKLNLSTNPKRHLLPDLHCARVQSPPN